MLASAIFSDRYIVMSAARVRVLILTIPTAAAGPVHAADTPPPATTTPGVVVTGQREDYRVGSLDSLGPLGTTPLLDTPYSVSVLPAEIIQNSQAINFKDVSKYLPLVAYQEQQGPDVLRPQTRGMQGGNFQNTKIDGMTMFVTVPSAMEEFQQIEVVNGVPASLYGAANPSGMFNFVTQALNRRAAAKVGVAYTSDSIGTVRADLGGKLGQNAVSLGYRLNALYGAGDGYVDTSHQRRVLGDLGLDIRAWTGGVLELNYADYSLKNRVSRAGSPTGRASRYRKRRIPSAGLWAGLRGRRSAQSRRHRATQARPELQLASRRGRVASGRHARHEHAGQQFDVE